MNIDRLFLQFVRGLFIVMILFGIGMIVVIFFGDQVLGLRMINAFASMFVGVLGLGSGYLLGRNKSTSNPNEKEDKT